jgi:fermentation-respiration switch protein FrsA (DUF1100 family)
MPSPAVPLELRIRVGENYVARAITAAGDDVLVIWIPHAAGTDTGSEIVARLVTERGWGVASLLPPADLPRPGAEIDEWASLVEERIRATRDALHVNAIDPSKCVALMGVSVGGIAALRVAELEESVDAVVGMLAGSGAEGLLHAARAYGASSAAPPLEVRRRLGALDPALHARNLGDRPVLLVRAWFDDVIPSDSFEALQRALGEPEVRTYLTGHEGFVYAMPWAVERALDWVGGACAGRLDAAGAKR